LAVGVVTNGTAVLGLGNIGPLAAKPVMEGKAVLFKKFADLDSFDIEVDMPDPVKVSLVSLPAFQYNEPRISISLCCSLSNLLSK
jgi:malic enzyme